MLLAGTGLLSLILADHRGWLLVESPGDLHNYDGRLARVVRVLDGGTIEVALPDERRQRPTTRVRLWGLHPGPGAQRQVSSLVGRRSVVLHLEPHRTRSAFGRVLAHVELPDRTLLNELLLAAGVAQTDERYAHAHLARYERAQAAARREGDDGVQK